MRNRIRKHCNAVNAKEGEVNNKFKHLLEANRPEVHSEHAQVERNNKIYEGGTVIWTTEIKVELAKKYQSLGRYGALSSWMYQYPSCQYFLLTRFIHSKQVSSARNIITH